MKKLELRKEYDGAQDHDLVLRAYHATDNQVCRIKRVLYHWRCHDDSTASNPESKRYAYEAGKRAIEDFLRTSNIPGAVVPTKHNGFFRVIYGAVESTTGEINASNGMVGVADIFKSRFDVGIVGGPVIKHNKITGGLIDETKTCPFDGMNINFSGYMHRASLQQDAAAVDVRKMYARKELLPVILQTIEKSRYREMFNCDLTTGKDDIVAVGEHLIEDIADEMIIQNISWEICEACMLEGYQILYDPNLEELL